jgi:RNA polymerase sigma-70 factor (ECF subfamily)
MSATLHEELIKLRPRLLRFARQRINDDATAEDAVQESLLAVLETPERFSEKSSLATYVIGILKFKIIDTFRQSQRSQVNEDLSYDELLPNKMGEENEQKMRYGITRSSLCEEFDPISTLEQKYFFTTLESAVGQLPRKSARIFALWDCMELESEEICQELGISKNNLTVSLHRARHALRNMPSIQGFSQATTATASFAQH